MDIKTLNETSHLKFRSFKCQEQWNDMIMYHYFTEPDLKCAMDYARRWAKYMQYLMEDDKSLINIDLCRQAAKAADIDNVTRDQKNTALKLLKYYWLYGRELASIVENGGTDTIFC